MVLTKGCGFMVYRDRAEQVIKEQYENGFRFYETEGMKRYFQQKREEHKYFCIFGGGVLGTTLCNWLKKHKIQVDFFCDNNQDKIDMMISGVRFIDFSSLLALKDETFVMVSATNKGAGRCYNRDINQQLSEFPYVMPNVLKFIAYYTNDYKLSYRECLDSAGRIMEALGDEHSRALFLELLKLKFVDNPSPFADNPLERFYEPVQYFNSDYYKHVENAVIVDCGAYNGDSLKEFVQLFGDDFERYHCFEMDCAAYSELEKNCAQLTPNLQNKIVLYPFGVFSEKGIAYYNALTDTLGSSISTDGKKQAQLAVLDQVLENERVTMIKMDIEDSELPALMGAKRLIEKNHPILAISIYHSTEQFFKIPIHILDNFPFYKLYLGLHTTITDDTVLYAIPEQE
ncbi:MAG: FkbM family methyltransferase [Lachnospiraceae bacterium]|nr:FkbM family methyltransferase [Lachnospiraceae bacterium]